MAVHLCQTISICKDYCSFQILKHIQTVVRVVIESMIDMTFYVVFFVNRTTLITLLLCTEGLSCINIWNWYLIIVN